MTPADVSNYIDQNLPSNVEIRIDKVRKVLKYLFLNATGTPVTLLGMSVDKHPDNHNEDELEPKDVLRGYWDKNYYWPHSIYLGGDPTQRESFYVQGEIYVPDDINELIN